MNKTERQDSHCSKICESFIWEGGLQHAENRARGSLLGGLFPFPTVWRPMKQKPNASTDRQNSYTLSVIRCRLSPWDEERRAHSTIVMGDNHTFQQNGELYNLIKAPYACFQVPFMFEFYTMLAVSKC